MAPSLPELRADCGNCFGLCCVALPFSRSADFAFDKPAGKPCVHLQQSFGCGIHDRLRPAGFPGCTVYDCFGAGQRIAQVTFGGRDWRAHPELAAPMFEAFEVMRQLHQLLSYLTEALAWERAQPLDAELRRAVAAVDDAAAGNADVLARLDVNALRMDAAPLLRQASALVRGPGRPDRSGADLMGADLRTADLRGADLHSTYLIAADLRGADLRQADLLGADLRDADLRGADLRDALYLSQPQLAAARGDAHTCIGPALERPGHWQLG
jgi:uncharacterized protein YjbI with pentapeptide repeats